MLKKLEEIGESVCAPDQRDGGSDHSHIGEGDVVLEVTGEIRLDEPLCLGEGLVATTAEEGNARETQQRGNQGAVRHPSQTAHTAVIATCNTTATHPQYLIRYDVQLKKQSLGHFCIIRSFISLKMCRYSLLQLCSESLFGF